MNNGEIDKRLKEIEDEVVLLSDYLGEAVEKKLGQRIGEIQERLDKFQKSAVSAEGGKIDISGLTGDFSSLHDEIGELIRSLGAAEYTDKKDNLTLRLGKTSDTILKELVSLEKNLKDGMHTSSESHEQLKQVLITNFDTLAETIGTIQGLCTVDGEKTLGGEIAHIGGAIGNITEQIPELSKTVTDKITALEKRTHDTAEQAESKREETKNTLLDNLDLLKATIGEIKQQLSFENETTLGGEFESIREKIGTLNDALSSSTENLRQELSSFDKTLKDNVQQTAAKQENVKNELVRILNNLDDNIEVLRRMCTTDDEKYLGSMMSFVSRKVEEMSEQLPEFAANVKKWLLALDKNVQTAARQTVSKQDEVKKILLYDINKIVETTESIEQSCITLENRPLGSEMIKVSDRVEKMSGELPETLDKVTALSDQLDRVTAEVKRMRWYVIGAVVISIIVLAASFFPR